MKQSSIVGLVSISDRASAGVYKDEGIPALKEWLGSAIALARLARRDAPHRRRAAGDRSDARRSWSTTKGCHLVLTTGGTGPAPRDVTPEATLAVADKVMPGFGEQMRAVSLKFVPTAILSRQVAVVRKRRADHQPARPAEVDPRDAAGLPDVPGSSPRCPTAST